MSQFSKQDIIALETAYWDAMTVKDGVTTAEFSAPTSLVTGPKGLMAIGKEKMGQMTEDGGWTLDSYVFDKVEVVFPNPEVAIIAYTVHQKGTMGGKAYAMEAADMSVWVYVDTKWECHGHSETPLQK